MATKYRTTDREQRKNNYLVVGIGYCDIQNIERYMSPESYTCGVYGWRADFYKVQGFSNVMISTGYAPLTYAYNKRAAKIGAKIKKDLLKYEKRLDNARMPYAWDKASRRVQNAIERIAARAFRFVEAES